MNNVLWDNALTLAVGLVTELDQEDFEEAAKLSHQELSGFSLDGEKYRVYTNDLVHVLELE